jgi:hypothetical protein
LLFTYIEVFDMQILTKRLSHAATCALASLLLGCSPSAPNDTATNVGTAPAASSTTSKIEAGQASIDTTPSFLPCSAGDGPISVKVRWQAPANVKIWVRSPSAEKLWTMTGASGELQSGKWVVPATQFVLRDAETDKTLAYATVGAAEGCVSNE